MRRSAVATASGEKRRRPGELSIGTFPGLAPRLLSSPGAGREDRARYESAGGYAACPVAGAELIDVVETAGLRGRGGAAFPTATKMRSVARGAGPRYLVANGEEGEPASLKDRWLLRSRPHLVLDGVLLAAAAIDADAAFVYLSDATAAQSVAAALDELGTTPLPVQLATVESTYVGGEETAVVRALAGGVAKPTDKPPRPFEAGIDGRPTLVANVETLANLPAIARLGAADFRAVGTACSPGTFLMTVSGACERAGLYEVPLGVGLGAAIDATAGFAGQAGGFLMGGFFAGLLGPRALDLGLAYDELRDAGSGLGCGAVIVLGDDDCPIAAAADVMTFFARENAKQCGACIRGTDAMRAVIVGLADGTTDAAQLDRLRTWSATLPGRGACGLLDGAAKLAGSLLREFPERVAAHLGGPCERCVTSGPPDREAESRFVMSIDAVRGGHT